MKLFAPIGNSKLASLKWAGRPWPLDVLLTVLFVSIEQIITLIALVITLVVQLVKNPAMTNSQMVNTSDVYSIMIDYMQSPAVDIVMLFCTVVVIIIVVNFTKKKERCTVREIGIKSEGFWLRYLGGLAIGFVMFSAAVFICKIAGAVDISLSNDTQKTLIPIFVVAWMIQGFSEEILCRGWMMMSIGRRYPVVVAVIINSIVFAGLHLMNSGISFIAVINLFLFGVFASILYLISENIWMVAALHSVWNFVQGNFYGILVSGTPITTSVFQTEMVPGKELFTGGNFGLEGGLGVTIVMVVGIVIAYVIYRVKRSWAFKED